MQNDVSQYSELDEVSKQFLEKRNAQVKESFQQFEDGAITLIEFLFWTRTKITQFDINEHNRASVTWGTPLVDWKDM